MLILNCYNGQFIIFLEVYKLETLSGKKTKHRNVTKSARPDKPTAKSPKQNPGENGSRGGEKK